MAMRCLEVTMGSTASLKENKASNKVDPYAVLRLGDVECRTDSEVVPGSRPVWNHRFNFLLPRDTAADPRELHVDVWDNSSGADAFLGSCKVAMARVYQKLSADITQPVHRSCGKLVGHLRFHFAVLVEQVSRGPETPPLPPPPAPLPGWLAAAAASPPARTSASPLSLPASASLSASEEKSDPRSPASGAKEGSEDDAGEPVSVSQLLKSLHPSSSLGNKGTKRARSGQSVGGEGEEGEGERGEEGEEVQDLGEGSLKGKKTASEEYKICKPKAQRAVSPSLSSAHNSPPASPRPLAPAPKRHWKAPPPLDLSTAFSPAQKAISAVERLMGLGLSPSTTTTPRTGTPAQAQAFHKSLAALIPDGPMYSPASAGPGGAPSAGFPDYFRPLPPLSDLATPAGVESSGAPSAMDQFERDCQSMSQSQQCQDSGLSGGPFQQLLKSNSTTSPLRGLGSEGAMSRSSSEKQWDVAALARLTSLFLNSQDQEAAAEDERHAPGTTTNSAEPSSRRGAPEESVLGSQAALASAVSAALLGTQQAGEKELPAPMASKRPLGSKSSAFKSTDSPPYKGTQSHRMHMPAERMLFNLLTSASSEAQKRRRVEA